MADLLDIAPSTACEVVRVGGKRIVVRGLNANAAASILARFPKLVGVILGGGIDFGPQFISQFGAAVGPIIAAGCGHLGNEDYENRGNALPLEDQLALVISIISLTFPNGADSFVNKVTALLPRADERARPVTIRRARRSPSSSPLSSDGASRQIM